MRKLHGRQGPPQQLKGIFIRYLDLVWTRAQPSKLYGKAVASKMMKTMVAGASTRRSVYKFDIQDPSSGFMTMLKMAEDGLNKEADAKMP